MAASQFAASEGAMGSGRKVLVVGSGGREHALAWRLLDSPSVAEVIVAPGNAGTARAPAQAPAGKTLRNAAGEPVQLARSEQVDLVVVGPEAPLCAGIVDDLTQAGIVAYGPSLYDRVLMVLRRGETVYPAAGPVWGSGISWTYVIVYRYGYRYEGFCASQYLSHTGHPGPHPDPHPDPGPPAGYRVRVVARGGLRLRSGPSLGYGVRYVVSYGTVLRATDVTRWGSGIQWRQVVYNGQYLWAASIYLRSA